MRDPKTSGVRTDSQADQAHHPPDLILRDGEPRLDLGKRQAENPVVVVVDQHRGAQHSEQAPVVRAQVGRGLYEEKEMRPPRSLGPACFGMLR